MAKKKIVSWEQKRKRYGYIFILPFIIGAVFFIIVPVVTSLLYSFSSLLVTASGYTLDFKGFDNYAQLFTIDPNFRVTLLESVTDMIPNVAVSVMFSFFMASIINKRFIGRSAVRGILFLPVILSSGIYMQLSQADTVTQQMAQGSGAESAASVSAAFVNMLNTMQMDSGLVSFLVSSVERISVIVSMSAIPIVIFLAGFQSISSSIFEAAYMEGASKWEVFWKISFPMVSPLILVCVVYVIVDSLTNSANKMIYLIHETSFTQFKFGLGSAMVWCYMAIMLLIIGIVYLIINHFVSYSD